VNPAETNKLPCRAIILVAGGGGRLRPLTEDRPKGLLEVGGAAIVEHQITCLRSAGIEQIALVTGHGSEKVRALFGDRVVYYHNDIYDRTNSLYSAWVARDFGRNGCLILNSDVLFHPALLGRLLDAPYEDCLLFDPASHLGEEEMKVILETDGQIRRISKDLDPHGADGENVGIIRLGRLGAERFFEEAERTVRQREWNHWVPYAIDRMCAAGYPFYAVGTGGLPWIEIDYLYDLREAEEKVYPRIRGAMKGIGGRSVS